MEWDLDVDAFLDDVRCCRGGQGGGGGICVRARSNCFALRGTASLPCSQATPSCLLF
jgi:hypothetical protein